MSKKMLFMFAVMVMWCVPMTLQAVPFTVIPTIDIEIGNDTSLGPNSNSNGSGMGIRNIDVRRRVSFVVYDISAVKAEGAFFSNVTLSNYGYNLGSDVDVYGVKEEYESLVDGNVTWSTAPGVQNDPIPAAGDPVALDLGDLTDKLMTFTPPGNGERGSTDPSQALADFLNADTTGIVVLLFAPPADGDQTILRTIELTNSDGSPLGGSWLEGTIGGSLSTAHIPVPAADLNDVYNATDLSWTSGAYAATHNLYLSTDFNDVNDGASAALVAQGLSDPMYTPSQVLDFGQTYYWRVDEVNAAPDSTVYPGPVWNFTVEPEFYTITDVNAQASSEDAADKGAANVVNGSGLTNGLHSTAATAMWISADDDTSPWIQFTFDKAYTLGQMKVWNYNGDYESVLGFGVNDVTVETSLDANNWTPVDGITQFAQGPGADGYAANNLFDLNGVKAQYVRFLIGDSYNGSKKAGLSEVQFTYTPTFARVPSPVDGASDIDLNPELSWRAGRGAIEHKVYLGTDPNLVAARDASVLLSSNAGDSLPVTGLLYNATYYWVVDAVDANDVIPGTVWSFSTLESFVVDDMESYNDDNNRIYSSWADGYGINGNGSQVGNLNAPFAEQTIVNSGSQSMPFTYDNTSAPLSEATLALDHQDWTAGGIKTLSIAFHGTEGNTGQLYVKINNTKVTYQRNPNNIALGIWQIWHIDLTALSGLQDVSSLTIGVDGSGAKGKLYFDDITLTVNPVAPNENTVKPVIVWVTFHKADDSPSGGAASAGFTEAPDKGYTDLLKANGYEVIRYVTTATPESGLDSADLIIAGRSVSSGDYQNDGATAWNSISAPMIITGGYTLRSSRMGYTTGTTMADTAGDIKLAVNNPNNPIFAGINLSGGTMVNPFAGLAVYPTDGTTMARGISVNTDPISDGGTLLATVATASDPAVGGMVIGEWQKGATMRHDGGAGTDILAGHRLVFLTGSREADGQSGETAGIYDLTADGQQMFLNAVEYMRNK